MVIAVQNGFSETVFVLGSGLAIEVSLVANLGQVGTELTRNRKKGKAGDV